jgi:hypothetical protein
VEGATVQDCFEQLAHLEDAFGAAAVCGLCGGRQLRHVVRENAGFKFFELHCKNPTCRGRLAFGQPKNTKGGLFVQRKDKDGHWKAHGGWEKWEPESNGHGNA